MLYSYIIFNKTNKILWNRIRQNIKESDQAKDNGSGSGKILWIRIRQNIMDPDQAKYYGSGTGKYYGIGSGKIL